MCTHEWAFCRHDERGIWTISIQKVLRTRCALESCLYPLMTACLTVTRNFLLLPKRVSYCLWLTGKDQSSRGLCSLWRAHDFCILVKSNHHEFNLCEPGTIHVWLFLLQTSVGPLTVGDTLWMVFYVPVISVSW